MDNEKEIIRLNECAKEMGVDKSNLSKYLKAGKYGNIKIKFIRDKTKGNQKVSIISKKDFEKIKNIRIKDGFGVNKPIGKENVGFFYIVQINPDNIPNRYKCGFSNIPNQRISSYKTVCPNAKFVFKTKCDDFFEKPLLKMISKNSKQIGVEIFEIKDINKIENKIEEVLKLLN